MLYGTAFFILGIGIYTCAVTIWNFLYFGRLENCHADTGNELVSVVIPARNEEDKLPALLDSLIAQSHSNIKIIVVDDGSTDRTKEIIEEYSCRDRRIEYQTTSGCEKIIKSGKITALIEGISHASGDYLVTTDADTVHSPDSIENALVKMKARNLDIFSGYPTVKCNGFLAGQCVIIMMLITTFIPEVLSCKIPFFAFGNGQFIMMKRESYLRTGGYASIKGYLVDDVGLVRLFLRNRMKYAFTNLSDSFTCYMYDDFRSAANGMERTMAGVLTDHPVPNILLFFAMIPASLLSLVFPASILLMLLRPSIDLLILILCCIPYIASWYICSRKHGWSRTASLSYPIPYFLLMFMFLRGARRRIHDTGFDWKGRILK